MWRQPVVTILMLIIAMILALPVRAQQKPFTQEQVVSMVRAGLGDDSGSKLIEQRGIDFVPAEDFIQTLKAAGASAAFLNVLLAIGDWPCRGISERRLRGTPLQFPGGSLDDLSYLWEIQKLDRWHFRRAVSS